MKSFSSKRSCPILDLISIFFRYFSLLSQQTNMPLARDLLHPSMEEERRKHKKKRLVQSPNSYFMDVKCPGCYKITTGNPSDSLARVFDLLSVSPLVFSHAQTVVLCVGCNYVLCSPSGGKARLTEGCSFRKKRDTPLTRKDDGERN